MYKSIILFACLAVASATPGLWGTGLVAPGYGLAASPIVGPALAAPIAPIASAPLLTTGIAQPLLAGRLHKRSAISPLGWSVPVATPLAAPIVSTSVVAPALTRTAVAPIVPVGSLGGHIIGKRSAIAPLGLSAISPIAPIAPISPISPIAWSGAAVSTSIVSPLSAQIAPLGIHSLHKRSAIASWNRAPLAAPLAVPVASQWGAPLAAPLSGSLGAPLGASLGARTWGAHAW